MEELDPATILRHHKRYTPRDIYLVFALFRIVFQNPIRRKACLQAAQEWFWRFQRQLQRTQDIKLLSTLTTMFVNEEEYQNEYYTTSAMITGLLCK